VIVICIEVEEEFTERMERRRRYKKREVLPIQCEYKAHANCTDIMRDRETSKR
jgi:hypothetical protein